jgi:hypothetical protein
MVRVPELAAFMVHKGATFRRRPDVSKMAKDLHYIVDVMQSGDGPVGTVAGQIETYCAEGGPAGELARQARNHVSLVTDEGSATALRSRLAEAMAVRHGISREAGDARASGFLIDFLELIPRECGKWAK